MALLLPLLVSQLQYGVISVVKQQIKVPQCRSEEKKLEQIEKKEKHVLSQSLIQSS